MMRTLHNFRKNGAFYIKVKLQHLIESYRNDLKTAGTENVTKKIEIKIKIMKSQKKNSHLALFFSFLTLPLFRLLNTDGLMEENRNEESNYGMVTIKLPLEQMLYSHQPCLYFLCFVFCFFVLSSLTLSSSLYPNSFE